MHGRELPLPKAPTKKVVEDATAALDTVRREWLRRPGVTAVDIGYKIKGDKLTDDIAVRVHVARKIPAAELANSEVFNETGKTPKRVGGFPVDVIEATYGPSAATATPTAPVVLDHDDVEAMAAIERTTAFDPLIGGISCGNPRVTAGTLGAIVFDLATCRPMILSNWHVLAGASAAAVGEGILQPGRVDGGTQVVATLTRMRLEARMDAAVATLNGVRGHSRDILGLGVINGIEAATLGMQVVKSGRTTGITQGVVDGLSLSVSIDYTDPGVVSFSNQIHIVPRPPWPAVNYEVSMGGDSGSVWLNEANNNAVGLHFAGETDPAPAAENAIANPIGPVATELNFSFLPVLCRLRPFEPPPVFVNICERYPWLCELLRRRFVIPDPPPFDVPFEDPRLGLRNIGALFGLGQAQGHGGCKCGDQPATDDVALAQLAALLAYLQQEA
jgi:hypothetical protein